MAAALDALYIETSAKQNLGVEDAFSRLCSKIVQRIRAGDINVKSKSRYYIMKLFLQVKEDTEGLKLGIHKTIIYDWQTTSVYIFPSPHVCVSPSSRPQTPQRLSSQFRGL